MSDWGDRQRRSRVRVVGGDVGVETGGDRSRVSRRPWIILVVVLVALGGVAARVGSGGGGGGGGAVSTSVPARLLSEFDPVSVDVTTSVDREEVWDLVELELTTRLGAVVTSGSGFVAVGHDQEGPGLWRSSTGEAWERFVVFEVPPGAEGSDFGSRWGVVESQLLEWEDSFVAFGWAEEAAAVWFDGDFGGFVDEFGGAFSTRVVASEQLAVAVEFLLAVDLSTESGPFPESWLLSSNGVDWVPISPTGLPEQGVLLVGWADGFFYATSWCGTEVCPAPGLYRSSDGVDWQDVKVETLALADPGFGQVVDIADVGETLLAVGFAKSGVGWESGMWRSGDGATWAPVLMGDAFGSATATLELVEIAPRYEGTAIFAVDGAEYELPEDSVIDTDAGRVTIDAINDNSVSLRIGNGGSSLLRSGTTLTLERTVVIFEIVTDNQHVALRGSLVTSVAGHDRLGSRVPAVWLSNDSGATWVPTVIDLHGDGYLESAAIVGDHIILTGSTNNGRAAVWHHQWPQRPATDR